ncbi:MAG: hypothetical protein EHM45_06700 [Desulfobacteraceae bacterium]|nr:MAG: hypothetical protein EHM45_06700 [Desulfobacteraceae bacterium]
MTFYREESGYTKTALSDLQGAWQMLRESVVEAHPFPESQRLLFHIDEAMSWENVRQLGSMRNILLLIRNIAGQAKAPEEISENIKIVAEDLEEVFIAIKKGEAI